VGDKGSVVLLQFPYFVDEQGEILRARWVGFPISLRAWRIWRRSSPLVLSIPGSCMTGRRVSPARRSWSSSLMSSGSLYSCNQGRMSMYLSSGTSCGMYRDPVLLECQGVRASPCRSRPAESNDWSKIRSCLKGLEVLG